MNFFFGVKSSIINSTLTIPRFQNLSFTKKKYEVFELQIDSGKWEFKILRDIEVNKDFYKIDSSLIKKENIFCLATKNEMLELEKNEFSKLINLNNFSDTSPEFRANLKVSLKDGGFSSYQSDYPFQMSTKKGSILTPLGNLCNINADENIIFLKNIYELPILDNFNIFFINLKTRKVLKKMTGRTNFLNEIVVENEFIHPEVFLFTDKYLGVPIFCSIKNKHISFEHSSPPHSEMMSVDRFKVINNLKKELNEIII